MNINHNHYVAGVDAMPGDAFAVLEQAVAARSYREKIGYGTFDEAAEAFRPHPGCPRCGSPRTARDGRTWPGTESSDAPSAGCSSASCSALTSRTARRTSRRGCTSSGS